METFRRRLLGKRVGISLSAGFFGFFAHAGFLRAIEEELGIVPAAIAGSSAGALVGALRASGISPSEIAEQLLRLRREDFWDRGSVASLLTSLGRPRDFRGYLSGKKLRELLSESLGARRVEDLSLPLFIVTTNASQRERHVVREGDLAEAVHASCAYPFLFQPVALSDEVHLDGGLVDKVPLEELVSEAAVEVVLVHLLVRERASAPLGAWRAFRAGVDTVRSELFRWKLQWARERGVEVYVFEPPLPDVSPRTMASSGPLAMERARVETLRIASEEDFDGGGAPALPSIRTRGRAPR